MVYRITKRNGGKEEGGSMTPEPIKISNWNYEMDTGKNNRMIPTRLLRATTDGRF